MGYNIVTIPDDVLSDVFSRFIIPDSRSNTDTIRICFAIEMAYWFYLDYIRPAKPELPECSVESFAKTCFKFMPSLIKGYPEPDLILKRWREFKRRVPVYGAILLTPCKKNVLLVEGHSTRGCWTFPRGKIEEKEDPFDCAVREVWEETSFDISTLADKGVYIEKVLSDRRVRLYIVNNVPENTIFYTKVRGEIASYRWFELEQLPGGPAHSQKIDKKKKEQFFMVSQFVRDYLKKYRNHGNEKRDGRRGVSESKDRSPDRRSRGHSFTESHQGSTPKHTRNNKHRENSFSARDNNNTWSNHDNTKQTKYVENPFQQSKTPDGSKKRYVVGKRGGRSRTGTRQPNINNKLSNFELDVEAMLGCLPPHRDS